MQTELSQCLHVGMMINKDDDDHGEDEDGDDDDHGEDDDGDDDDHGEDDDSDGDDHGEDDDNTSGNKDGMFRSKDGGRRSRMCT